MYNDDIIFGVGGYNNEKSKKSNEIKLFWEGVKNVYRLC